MKLVNLVTLAYLFVSNHVLQHEDGRHLENDITSIRATINFAYATSTTI